MKTLSCILTLEFPHSEHSSTNIQGRSGWSECFEGGTKLDAGIHAWCCPILFSDGPIREIYRICGGIGGEKKKNKPQPYLPSVLSYGP